MDSVAAIAALPFDDALHIHIIFGLQETSGGPRRVSPSLSDEIKIFDEVEFVGCVYEFGDGGPHRNIS